MTRVTDPTIFGQLFVAHEIETAAIDTLNLWMYTYLRELERQLDLPDFSLPPPTRYTNRNSFDAVPGEPLARIAVIAGGIVAPPYVDGNGRHLATWRLGVGAATNHEDELQARFMANCYATACLGIMVQKASLGGVVNMTEWVDWIPVELPIRDQLLQYRAVRVDFNCQVSSVVTRGIGPDIPDTPPDHDHGPYPEVEKVYIDLENVPLMEAFNGG